MRHKEVERTAAALFGHIDLDGSGGISFKEFQPFCRSSLIFLMLAHEFQRRLRDKLFADVYWKKQTIARADLFTHDEKFQVGVTHDGTHIMCCTIHQA